jgi:hypothetical protein
MSSAEIQLIAHCGNRSGVMEEGGDTIECGYWTEPKAICRP